MQKLASLFWLLAFFTSSCAYGRNYNKAIDQEIKEVDPHVNIGVKIKNLSTGKVVYERNAKSYYNFASSLKFIVLLALRQYLGDDYIFTSKIWQKGDDCYLTVHDPDFSTSDLESMINRLKIKTKNIRNFYIINAKFSLPAIIESKMVEDTKYCYGAPITKVHINKNCIKLQLNSQELGLNKKYIEKKESTPYKVVNNIKTIPVGYNDRLDITVQGDSLIVNGTLNKGYTDFTASIATNDNLNYIKLILQNLLDKNNIKITGKILYSAKLPVAKAIIRAEKNFYQLASYALKRSDDFITDYLLAEFADIYGVSNWREASMLLKQYIAENFTINLAETIIVDSSGLSRYNMLTPAQFDEFLTRVYQDQNFNIIKMMLARPSEAGTLHQRFQGVNIFAKTGSMAGISSLTGYVFDKNNIPYSFVIVSNNYLGPKLKYANLEEKIIRILIHQ